MVRLAKESRKQPELAAALAATEQAREILDDGRTIAEAAAAGDVDAALLAGPASAQRQAGHLCVQRRRGRARRPRVSAPGSLRWRLPPSRWWSVAQIEAEVAALDPVDAAEFLAGYGQEESGLVQLVHVGFRTLGLQTFLTAGPKEARAWTIHVGDTAPQAAGTIHTDFERGFIKAEIVGYEDLIAAGSLAAARAAGRARIEGKEYVMQDGDVVEFRFQV